ncbi:ATP-binding protein [Thiomicrorhabdus aquaedulcis]|uniref:ATP-binding protein n=1 Tax=Thiomicrorhabdus aquaedulcis TaxID=2211106 RepID=UPI000FD7E211|nr:ATP-binding protein [Thiomicrorhabdus aquaedulcis]
MFADAQQFVILNDLGIPVIGSPNYLLGPRCLEQIDNVLKAEDTPNVLEVHEHNGQYRHYDIITKLERGSQQAMLLISFSLDGFSHLLDDFSTAETEFLLVDSHSIENVISATSAHIPSIQGRILPRMLASEPIADTAWQVVGLHKVGSLNGYEKQVLWLATLLFVMVLVVVALVWRHFNKVTLARKKLQESSRHDAMFNAGPTVLFEKDAQHNMAVRYVSPNVNTLLGCDATSLIEQRGFMDLVHPDDIDAVSVLINQAIMAGKTEVELEYRLMHQVDWSFRWVYDLTHILYDAAGQVVGLQGYVTSVHEQKLAEQRANDLIENSPDAMVVSNELGEIILVNQALEETFEYTRAELIGRSIDLFVPNSKRDAHVRYRQQYLSMQDVKRYQMGQERELFGVTKSGRLIPVAVDLSRMQTPDGVLILSIIRDITVQKAAQAQMQTAKETAESLAKARSRFLATMSHEIRTPMNGVLGMTDLLHDTALDTTQRNYLNAIKQSGQALLGIINEILDFSKLDEGEMRLESQPFDLYDVVNASVQLLMPQAHNAKVEVNYHFEHICPKQFNGDAGRIRQVVLNLLSNAIKFAQEGQVDVGVKLLNLTPEGAQIELSVTDNGIGIAPDYQAKLFDFFTQADDSTTRKYGGTGLGLAITKQLVELMGGTIGVESEQDKGSTFWVKLPILLHQVSESTDSKSLDESDALRALEEANSVDGVDSMDNVDSSGVQVIESDKPLLNRRVLLVEDNLINQMLAVSLLEKLGATVDVANNGLEGLESWRLHGKKYCVVLMDCQMPLIDGYEATTLIRQEEESSDEKFPIPIVALTANAMKEDREMCFAVGMSDFLAKPINIAQFNAAVVKWAIIGFNRH